MADVEGQHVADFEVVSRIDAQIGVLVHQLGHFPVRGWGLRHLCAGAEVEGGDGEAGVEGGVTAAHADDGAGGLGDGLHVSPDVERGFKAGVDGAGNGIRLAHALLGAAIAAGVMGEIAAGTENHVGGVRDGREFFRNEVEPGGAGSGENGFLGEAVFGLEASGEDDGALKELANGGLVVENAFIDFDSAEAEGGSVEVEGGEESVELMVVAYAGAAVVDA